MIPIGVTYKYVQRISPKTEKASQTHRASAIFCLKFTSFHKLIPNITGKLMWLLINNCIHWKLLSHLMKEAQRQSAQIMCKAQNNFQLVLVKMFSQTYYCLDTKFWPDKCPLCHILINPHLPLPQYISRHSHSSVIISPFTVNFLLHLSYVLFW